MERGLLQRAFSEAVKRPGLLLPALVADALAFGLESMRTGVLFAVFSIQMHRLESRRATQSAFSTLYRFGTVLGGTTRVITTILALVAFTAALLTTVALFREGSGESMVGKGLRVTRQSLRAIIVFCVKLFGLLAAAELVLMLIYAVGENRLFIATTGFVTMSASLALAAVGSVIAPIAYRLLERQGATPLSRADARSLRLAAFTCVAGSGLVSLACTALEHRFISVYEPLSVQIVGSMVSSLISALPYSLLFISFAVLSVASVSEPSVFETAAGAEGEPG